MRRPVVALSVLLLAALAAAAPAAGDVMIREVDLSGFPTVRVIVSSDDLGPIARKDVAVTENGVPVEVTGFRRVGGGSGDVEVVLAIDVSNSMRGRPLSTAIGAAKTFVERVPPWISVAVVSFAGTTDVVTGMTSDRSALHDAIASMGQDTRRGTALFEGVVASTELFSGEGQHNVILLTDGRNTVKTTDLEGAVAAANDADATVFTIGLEGPETDATTLRTLAESTGGAHSGIGPDDLDAAYTSLARQFAQQFVVAYRSKAPHGAPIAIEVAYPGGVASIEAISPAPQGAPGSATSLGGIEEILATSAGFLIPVALTFLAAVVVVVVLSGTREDRRRKRELAERISAPGARRGGPAAHGATVSVIPHQLMEFAERGAAGSGLGAALEGMLARAGWSLRVGELVIGSIVLMAISAFAASLSFGPIGAVVAAPIVGLLPLAFLSNAGGKRVARLQGQLADVCMILASSLRAGHSFLQSLDTVSKEIGEPAATEFNRALAEIRLGRPVEEAMDALAGRIASLDLEWAVTAINIQRKVGGNLAEVLETVAATIRERETLRRQVRALTSEGRLSATILTVLPFLVWLYLMVVNPGYLANLTGSSVGLLAIGIAAVLMVIGYAWMRKIVKIDV